MRIDLATVSPVRVALADSRQTPPEGTRARTALSALLAASPLQLAVLALTVLLGGISVAVASTSDPVWWHEHFSRLGTFGDASSAVFNGTLITGGAVVLLLARAAERELRRLSGVHVRRGAARTTRILFSAIGAGLALTGCVPLDVNKFVHEHITMVMVAGFAGLLLTSPLLMHRMPKRLLASTLGSSSYLGAGAWLFFGSGMINLALFEVIAFSAMFGWTAVFVFCLSRRCAELATHGMPRPAAVGLDPARAETADTARGSGASAEAPAAAGACRAPADRARRS
ncbi:MAG: hypothetical protein QM604_02870, partial [Microbacterium sp.]